MISKTELKRLISYKQSKYRNADNLFVVEGEKMCDELLMSDFDVIAIYATQHWLDDNNTKFADKAITVYEISNEELNRISLLSTPNKALCLVRKPCSKPIKYEKHLTIALDDIRDPGNLGSIMRIADWFGIINIICSKQCVDAFNPKVVQASMGSIFRVNMLYEDLESVIRTLPKNFPIYGTVAEKGKNIYQTTLSQEGIIVIGNESFGINKQLLPLINQFLTIPRFSLYPDKPESLNASVASAIVISEFCRKLTQQRNI